MGARTPAEAQASILGVLRRTLGLHRRWPFPARCGGSDPRCRRAARRSAGRHGQCVYSKYVGARFGTCFACLP
eukprot:1029415-Prymnesium_polylepis.1